MNDWPELNRFLQTDHAMNLARRAERGNHPSSPGVFRKDADTGVAVRLRAGRMLR